MEGMGTKAVTWSYYTKHLGLKVRKYETYQEYLVHQQSKEIDLRDYRIMFKKALLERLTTMGYVGSGMSALCLGARDGTEVEAFKELGCFAVGVDIRPRESQHVLYGDFHELQFPDESVDIVFTNSLDHMLRPHDLFKEVRRVLKYPGYFITEIVSGDKEGHKLDIYGSFHWESVDTLIEMIEEYRMVAIRQTKMSYPWGGEHIVFRST